MKRLLAFVLVACKIKGLEHTVFSIHPSTPCVMLTQAGLALEPETMAALIEEAGNFKLVIGLTRGELTFFQEAER